MSGPRRIRLTPRAVVLVVIVLVLGMAAFVPLRQYMAQRAQVERLEERVEELADKRRTMTEEIARLEDPAYLERLARCLGWLKPGEIGFVTVPEGSKPRPGRC